MPCARQRCGLLPLARVSRLTISCFAFLCERRTGSRQSLRASNGLAITGAALCVVSTMAKGGSGGGMEWVHGTNSALPHTTNGRLVVRQLQRQLRQLRQPQPFLRALLTAALAVIAAILLRLPHHRCSRSAATTVCIAAAARRVACRCDTDFRPFCVQSGGVRIGMAPQTSSAAAASHAPNRRCLTRATTAFSAAIR